MKVVDANVLIYAVNGAAVHHDASHEWLDRALNGAETVGFAWVAMLAFVRLTTKVGVFPTPLPTSSAFDCLDGWLAQPGAVMVAPTARHVSILRRLLADVGSGGNVVNDAHLAALAIEHRGTVVSFDRDFARFSGVSVQRPA